MEAGLPPDSVEVDGSAFKSFVAYMEAGATCMLPCKEVDGSKWKLTQKQIKLLNEATSLANSMEVKGIKLISVEFRGSFHGSLLISVQVGVSMQEVDGNLHGSTLKNQVNSVEDRVLSALGDHG